MFKDPMLQISLPDKAKDDYADFPLIDFSNLIKEFDSELPIDGSEIIDLNGFERSHKTVEETFDKTWSGYTVSRFNTGKSFSKVDKRR